MASKYACVLSKWCWPYLVGGFNHLEKYEFVSWDDYSQYMGKLSSHVPNHQPVIVVAYLRPSTLSPGDTLLKVPTSSNQTIPSGYVKIAIENGH